MMTSKRTKQACGFTFTEVMGAILVLTVAVLGASAYRYHATLDVRKADVQTTGARIACLLCETWRGSIDPNTFDPTTHFSSELTVESVMLSEAPAAPTGHTVLNLQDSSRGCRLPCLALLERHFSRPARFKRYRGLGMGITYT